MDVERRMISAIVRLQDMDPLLAYPIEPHHFLQRAHGDKSEEPLPGEVYEWLLKHRRSFQSVPSVDLLRSRFPKFEFAESTDGVGPLLEEFLRQVNRRAAYPLVRDLHAACDDPGRQLDLSSIFFEKARELAQEIPTDKITRLSQDVSSTLDLYKIRAESGEMPGVSTCMKWLDDWVYCIQPHELMIVTAFLGTGKAQPLDAKIMTPNGWVKMSDLKIGDEVSGQDGGRQIVTNIIPQGQKQVYRVTFRDGTSTECCDDHLWALKSISDRKTGADWQVLKLKDVMNDLRYPSGQLKWYAPMPEPIEHQKQDVLIDPYVMGMLLGDGGLKSDSPIFTSADRELVDALAGSLPDHMSLKPIGNYGYRISGPAGSKSRGSLTDDQVSCIRQASGAYGSIATAARSCGVSLPLAYAVYRGECYTNDHYLSRNVVTDALRTYGLKGLGSHEKFIPEPYMRGSIEQRLHLLQGLMDTDGFLEGSHAGVFCSTSKIMAHQVLELGRSLGGRARIQTKQTYCSVRGERKAGKPSWYVTITLPNGLNPFRLERKASKYKGNMREQARGLSKILESIEPTRVTETQCIMVSNPNHLYVTDDYIVTHNSTYALAVCADAYFKAGKTPMFFSLEMEDHKLTQRWVAAATGISYRAMKRPAEQKLSNDDLRKWEEMGQRVEEASIDKDILMLSRERRPSVDYVYSMIETYHPDVVVVDTIDKIKAPSHLKSMYERGYHAASELKAIARTTKVPIIAIAQANRSSVEDGVSLQTIANSIAIASEGDIALGIQANEDQKKAHMREFKLLKNRDDGGEGTSQCMYFHPGTMELREWRANDSVASKSS